MLEERSLVRVAKTSAHSQGGTPWHRPWVWLPTMGANQGMQVGAVLAIKASQLLGVNA